MIAYLEILNDFVEDPRRAAAEVRERRPWGLGLACFLASGLSLFVAQSLSRRFLLLPPGPVAMAFVVSWHLVAGVVFTGVLHLAAEASGGEGKAGGLFVLLGLSSLVWTLAVPVVLLLKLAGADGWLATAAMLAVLGWASLALKARSLRDNYGLGVARSWFLLSLPYAAAALAAMALVSLAVAGILLSLVRIFR